MPLNYFRSELYLIRADNFGQHPCTERDADPEEYCAVRMMTLRMALA